MLGILGQGYWGKILLRNLEEMGHQISTFDPTKPNGNPEMTGCSHVFIATPTGTHQPLCEKFLKRGVPVFCEKPLAINNGELDQIEKAVTQREENPENSGQKAKKPLLMVGFNRRFAPLARQMKEFLSSRTEPLVAHYRVNAGYLPLTHWTQDSEQAGGRIIGEACHFIDFLTFLVGESPLDVRASALPNNGRYNEDNVVMTFHFPDGSLGTVSYLANGDKSSPKEQVDVFCGGRVAVLNDYRSLETILSGRKKIYRSRLRQDKGHQAEWKTFVHAILSADSPPIPYDQLIGVTRASFAAVEALRSRETIKITRVAKKVD